MGRCGERFPPVQRSTLTPRWSVRAAEDEGLGGQRALALGFCRVVMRCRASVPFPVSSTLDDAPSAEQASGRWVWGSYDRSMADTIARSTRRGCVRLL